MPAKEARDTILFIGAHHEEMEAECPALPMKLAAQGHRVIILNPVGGWNWVHIRKLGPRGKERTVQEASNAAAKLGCEKVIWDYPVAKVWEYRTEITIMMADFIMDVKPSIVFIHWPYDTHADHREIARISSHVLHTAINLTDKTQKGPDIREVYAFQTGMISQAYNFIPDFTVAVKDSEMKKAEEALKCFKGTSPSMVPMWINNVKVKAAFWGHYSGVKAAEAYKFIGPLFPVGGLRLASLLGKEMIARPFEKWQTEEAYHIQ